MTTILIVDDSGFQRKMIKKALAPLEFTTIEASNGKDALDLLSKEKPDCITLDLGLPDLTGFDLLAEFKKVGLSSPVIVLTADIQSSSKSMCLDLGAKAVLSKPLNGEELRQTITALL